MSKSIWYLHPYAGSPSIGYAGRSYYLSREFNRMGFQAHIISTSYHHLFNRNEIQKEKIKYELLDEASFVWLKANPYQGNGIGRLINMLSYSYKVWRYEKKLVKQLGKPDVLIVSSPHPFHYLAARIIAKKYHAKIIFEVRDLWPLSLIEIWGISIKHPLIYLLSKLETWAYQSADFVVSLLPNSFAYMQKKGLDAKRFFHIPNGVEIIKVDNTFGLQAAKKTSFDIIAQKKEQAKFIVGYIGSHGVHNALDQLVAAMRVLQERNILHIHVFFVGKGTQKELLKQQAKNLSNVTFLDPVPKPQVMSFLSLIDVAFIGWKDLHIYKYGISPNKIFEYMLAKKPIVHATNTSFDIVAKSECGISVLPDQAGLLADTLINLSKMSNQELLNMGVKGSMYIAKHHDYHLLAKQFTRLFV